MNARKHLTLCVGLALLLIALVPAGAQADFGLKAGSVAATATDAEGNPVFQAGSHPFAYTVEFAMNLNPDEDPPIAKPEGKLRDLIVDLPPGLVGNPTAVPTCPQALFEGLSPQCPTDTQIGFAEVRTSQFGGKPAIFPVYLVAAPLGFAARIGFSVVGENSFQDASLRSDGDYGVKISDITIPTQTSIQSVAETIWGAPADSRHDEERQCANAGGQFFFGCPTTAPLAPFLTLPTSCGAPLKTTVSVDSFENPGVFESKTVESENQGGTPTGLDGCNALEFEPAISSQPTTNLADSPSGLDFNLHQPQEEALSQGAGSIERCTTGTWSGEPTEYAFQWLRNGAPIPGATEATYLVGGADVSAALQCEVTATNPAAAGPGHAASNTVVIDPPPVTAPPAPVTPKIEVKAAGGGGKTATCKAGAWGGEPALSFQWLKDGQPLPGASGETFEIAPGEAPLTLQCVVSGTNAGGTVIAYSDNRTSEPPLEPELPNATAAPRLALDISNLGLATAHVKETTVTLPQGMTLNPSAGNGLEACSESEIGYQPSGGEIHFSKDPQSCPNASKVGTLEVSSPPVDHTLEGAVYLAKPYANPFGSLLAIYLAVEDEQTGVIAKLAGKVTPDPATGQLTATFTDNPQLPLEDIDLHFFGGARGALKTPLVCGKYTTNSTLTPWSTPEGADASPSDSFSISAAAGGIGPCPTSEAQAPNKPAFTAGTLAPKAGAYSPFVLKLSREDGSQQLRGLDTTLPKGLAAKLAGIPYCSEAQIAQAKGREAPNQGALEQQSPSCPLASEVGTVMAGAGAGITPLYVQGHAYLAGPYKGAPLSFVFITPAVAGPFDLGAVVVRTALYVNSETAQGRAVSDPLPSIIQGIPLDLRSVVVDLARPAFTLNPTSCDPTAVTGSALALTGQSAALSSPFQVGGCNTLKFKPKLAISLNGATKRAKHPALKALVTYPKGSYANIASAQVTLPHAEFLEQSHIRTICTRVQFAIDQCPKASIYGFSRAFTPLLDKPLEGPVYLRSSSHELPDLVAALHGQIDIDLVGRIDTGKGGGIRSTFEAVPDAPVSKFVLEMQGGKKGLLVNSENICKKPQRATVSYSAQNGKNLEVTPLVGNSCGKKGHKGKKKRRGHRR